MWHGIEAQGHRRRFDVHAVNIEVVGAVNLGSVQLGTSDKQMDQSVGEWKSRLRDVLEQVRHKV